MSCYDEFVDGLERGMNRGKTIRVVAAVTTDLVREACLRHELTGLQAVALGRALTGGCLLSTLTKRGDERVRIQLHGGGPLGRILIDSRSDGSVRGCLQHRLDEGAVTAAKPHGRARVRELVGRSGNVVVTRDVGLDQQYQGTVEVTSGEIDVDLESYLNRSEQLPSVLACEVVLDARDEVLRAAGILCQTFPDAGVENLEEVHARVHGDGLADLLRVERTTAELMGFALGGEAVDKTVTTQLSFRCGCSPARALQVLTTLGAEDLDSLADEPGETEVRCSFCGARYSLAAPALHALAERLRLERS